MFDKDGKLDVFENFRIDSRLPKHQQPTDSAELSDIELAVFEDSKSQFNISTSWEKGSTIITTTPRRGFISRFVLWLKSWFTKTEPKPSITIEDFFRSIKNSTEELKIVDERASGYTEAMVKAKTAGQTALYEQLERGLSSVRSEGQLVAMGLGKYLEEETLVAFVKKAKKGLRLDWVGNFIRVIPDSVLGFKIKADERHIFDNYVVLHYDPTKKSWSETEAEKTSRKDPILFGVVQGRRRLYYVGDWQDEFCDLTLDQIADVLGQDAVKTA